jgi:outer membrane receptor protein involved in Fe transport
MNELYRTGQVGQQITLANPQLLSERATGWEAGVQLADPARNAIVRASYFWTEVNRPITALTLSQSDTGTLLQRENLGQIRSRGLSLDGEMVVRSWFLLGGGYQYARATVTQNSPNPSLVGNWIPQVPRNTGTVQGTFTHRRWGTAAIQFRGSGRQYDDDQNHNLLHTFFRMDAYLSHSVNQHVELFLSGENLFDRNIEVGRTPVLTLGTPRLVQGGIRLYWANPDRS